MHIRVETLSVKRGLQNSSFNASSVYKWTYLGADLGRKIQKGENCGKHQRTILCENQRAQGKYLVTADVVTATSSNLARELMKLFLPSPLYNLDVRKVEGYPEQNILYMIILVVY